MSKLEAQQLVRDLEYFIHTKFHKNPSSDSWQVENVNCLTNDGQTTDEQTPDNGAFTSCALKNQSIFSIKHSVLWLFKK